MVLPLSAVSLLFGSSAPSGGVDFSFLTKSSGSSGTATASAGDIKAALVNAEKNEAKQLAQVAKDPQVQKDLARYAKVVKNAKTMDDVLNDPVARKVFMTANGLKSDIDNVGLAKKALSSNPSRHPLGRCENGLDQRRLDRHGEEMARRAERHGRPAAV